MSELQDQLKAAHEFANQHVRELAAEIIEWQKTAILRDGRLRELAVLCSFATHDSLRVAEHTATYAALELAAGLLAA